MSTLITDNITCTSTAEIESVVRGFESCALSRADWTHAAHLTVALWYHLHLPWTEAEQVIRDGIKRFNASKGILTTPTRGYHETMTLFWIHMVRNYLNDISADRLSFTSLFNGLIERCGRSDLPFEYYSRDRLMSSEARATWVEPDLRQLRKGQ